MGLSVATTLWFHDHTLGITRISVLSGLAGMYFVRDQYDTGLAGNPLGLPAGDQEVELVLQDRQFDTNGQWYFPDSTSNGQGLITPGLDDRVMQFRVQKPLSSRDTTFNPASGAALRGGANHPAPIVRLANPTTGKLGSGVKADLVRQLVLVEVEGDPPAPQPGGPIEVLLNNTRWDGLREGSTQVAGGAVAQPDGLGNMVTELQVQHLAFDDLAGGGALRATTLGVVVVVEGRVLPSQQQRLGGPFGEAVDVVAGGLVAA